VGTSSRGSCGLRNINSKLDITKAIQSLDIAEDFETDPVNQADTYRLYVLRRGTTGT